MADELTPTDKMPVLFLGHGSPMNAIDDNRFTRGFRTAAEALPSKPKAILCISAHWYTNGTRILGVDQPETIHDFGGFPQELFDVQYPAPGDPELARETLGLVGADNATIDNEWGLDHGAWSVIKHMYPDADIPVIQMSIDYTKPPEYHMQLGAQLAALRQKGVLIVGSGNIVHNLRKLRWTQDQTSAYGYDWAIEAQEKINELILDGNYAPLLKYQNQGEAWKNAIPTPDHYLPLIYTLGLKEQRDEVSLFNDELLLGSISMTSLRIG